MATDTQQQIELECQQVQEQLLKLTTDRETLREEFERISSCSQHLLQQIQEDSSQASGNRKSKFETEKEKLEEKLKALEKDIQEKNEKIEFLDDKASEYLLKVSTMSNSLFDSYDTNISKDEECGDDGSADIEKSKISEVLTSIDSNESVDCFENKTSEQGPESVITAGCIPESFYESSNKEKSISKVSDNELNLNVEVKTVINLVMEEVPVEDRVVPSEGLEMSEACSKAILTTNQVIKNIQEQIERNEINEVPVELEMQELAKTTEEIMRTDESYIDYEINNVCDQIENKNNFCEVTQESETLPKIELVKREILTDEPSAQYFGEDLLNGKPASKVGSPEPSSQPAPIKDIASPNGESGKQSNGSGSPVREQMMSLSLLVAELRRVKDDMGKCMSVKEQSFIELEDQLQAANREVASLKLSMAHMSKDLEEKEQRYQALEEENMKKKMDIELKMKEVQGVTNKCSMLSEEKLDILRKMEVLEIMMTEYRTEIEMLVAEKNKLEEDTKQLLSAKTAASLAEAEIDSRTNVEEKEKEIEELVEKIQSMEKQMKELNDKLKVTNKHLKVMAREREHKQKECEVLKRKVELVELKMCELQGTFDMLVKAVMVERDELIREMEEKNCQIDDVHHTLAQLKVSHEQELEKVMLEKRLVVEELHKYKSGELKPVAMVDQKQFDFVSQEKERLVRELQQKTEQRNFLETKLKSLQEEMDDFVGVLKDEMSRLKEETEKTQLEKKCIEETFASLQADHLEVSSKYQSMEKLFQELEKSNKEKTANLEILKLQLDDFQHQLEDLNTKNFNLSSEMHSKEEEFREELSAREGTIQELNVTLTNNQKQSMENYNALQEDMAALQTKFKTSVEESTKQMKEFEDRLKQSQEDKKKEIAELQGKVKTLIEELREAKLDVTESQTSFYQECESLSVSQDAELQSSSLAVAPSLPLDTVADSSTSHSLRTEAKCGEAENESQQVEELQKQGKELEELLHFANKKIETKETEIKRLVECDIPQLNEKIQNLTDELHHFKNKTPENEAFKSQVEFEALISKKEQKIQELETKVNELEVCLVSKNGYISHLEGLIEGSSDAKNDVETHLQQIRKLSADISKMKDELKKAQEQCETLQQTVDQFEKDKQCFEKEKAKIVEEYENKLQNAGSKLEEVKADLEEKKKLG